MMEANETEPRKKNRFNAFLFQIVLVVTVLSLIWFSFGQNVLAPQGRDGVPQRLGDLELVSSTEGSEAFRQVSQLHGTDIDLTEVYIAGYARGDEEAMIWVGRAESSDAAKDLINRMADGITKGNSGFNNLKRISVTQNYHSHEVYQVDGPDGQHFFYISRKLKERVVWLSIEASNALTILDDAINTF